MAGMHESRMACMTLILAIFAQMAQAQVFKFEDMPVPATFSLSTHYMFFVYAPQDAPQSKDQVASVEFRGLTAKPLPGTVVPKDYQSVEVSLLPFDMFWSLVNKDKFCSSADDVRNSRTTEAGKLMLTKPRGQSLREIGANIEQVPFEGAGQPKTVSYQIKKTGAYILTYTNCGNFSTATISGSLAVKNAYGYLPANEFNTMRLFGWLTVAYVLLMLVYFGALVRHWKTLFYIQKGIASIMLLCVIECFATWVEYNDWNKNGERGDLYFVVSLLFYTLKYVLSWRLLLLSSLGAGVVLQDLDTKTSVLFFVASTLFMVQSCLWKLLISYRYSHALETGFLMMVTLPGVIIYAGMFFWTFLSLSTILTRIEEQKQDDLAKTFGRVRSVLIGGLILATMVLFLQLVDISYGSIFQWEYQWFSVDGAPQFAFMVVLTLMMWVWWPNEDSWKFGYMVQVDQQDGENEAVNTAVDDPELSRGHGKMNAVAPDQIGACEDL